MLGTSAIVESMKIDMAENIVKISLDLPGEETSSIEVFQYSARKMFRIVGKNRGTKFNLPEKEIYQYLAIYQTEGVSLAFKNYEIVNGVFEISLYLIQEEPIKLEPSV